MVEKGGGAPAMPKLARGDAMRNELLPEVARLKALGALLAERKSLVVRILSPAALNAEGAADWSQGELSKGAEAMKKALPGFPGAVKVRQATLEEKILMQDDDDEPAPPASADPTVEAKAAKTLPQTAALPAKKPIADPDATANAAALAIERIRHPERFAADGTKKR